MDRRTLGARALGAAGLLVVCLASGVLFPSAEPDGPWMAVAGDAPATPASAVSTPRAATSEPAANDPKPATSSTASPPTSELAVPPDPPVPEDPTPAETTVTRTTSPASPPARSTHTSHATAGTAAMPAIAPSPATHVSIPAIGVNAPVLPVDSTPTGQKNAWGGEVYQQINFPVDDAARQWVRRGDPNSLPPTRSAGNVKAFDRVMIYGHASDIGYHLVFQDLSALRPGQSIVVDTAKGRFTYRVTTVTSSQKAELDQMAELYRYPTDGRKEIALIACLPDTTLNTVVLGVLVGAKAR